MLYLDAAEDVVFKSCFAAFGNAEAEDVRRLIGQALLPFRVGELAAGSVVFPGAAGGCGAFGLQLFRGAEAGIGVAPALEVRGQNAVAVQAVRLMERPF